MNNQGLDSLNGARALRIAEIMTDFRNMQYYLGMAKMHTTPTAEEYYLEGYSLLRQCTSEAQAIVTAPFSAVTLAWIGPSAYTVSPLWMKKSGLRLRIAS